ncbi:hypothetical protein [Herbaspirillum huttiense]|uniref:hypothetical protein n=1 Tax=Herbaspirillum huttiense TaxID=863372 RepID=UPI002176C7FC|nr:hypothetical protein [Herbaspirillum huttiense]UWE19383.1 hypothetical protein NY669_26775 [Herbaspirillum huttiense]
MNTHLIYQTIDHQHLDVLVNWAIGNYPDAGINLVECKDGRWFVEVDFGTKFDGIQGVSRPKVLPFAEPRFWGTEQEARDFAIACIKQAYPETAAINLQQWFDNYDTE